MIGCEVLKKEQIMKILYIIGLVRHCILIFFKYIIINTVHKIVVDLVWFFLTNDFKYLCLFVCTMFHTYMSSVMLQYVLHVFY